MSTRLAAALLAVWLDYLPRAVPPALHPTNQREGSVMKTFTKYLAIVAMETVAMTVLTKIVQNRFADIEEGQRNLFDLGYTLEARLDAMERLLDDEEIAFDDDEITVAQGLGYPSVLGYDTPVDTRPIPFWAKDPVGSNPSQKR